MSSKPRTKMLIAAVLIVLTLAVAGGYYYYNFASQTVTTLVTRTQAATTQATAAALDPALIEAAKKEGKLIAYVTAPNNEVAINEFGKEFGIQIEVVRFSTDQLIQRVSGEAGGGLSTVDIVYVSPPAQRPFDQNQWFIKYSPPGIPAAMKASDYFTNAHSPLKVFVYNPTIMKSEELPKTWDEIADLKFKGKFTIADPTVHVTTVNLLLNLQDLWGQERLGKWLKAVYVDNQAIKQVSLTPTAKVVESGQAAFGLTFDTTAGPMIQSGQKLKFFFPNDIAASRTPEAVGVYFKAPHPNAGKLYVNWISQLSIQNRAVSGLMGVLPAHPDADPPAAMSEIKGKNMMNEKQFDTPQYNAFIAWFKALTGS